MTVAGIPIPRVMLHARTLGFTHPTGGEYHEFDVPFPPDMEQVQDLIRDALTQGRPAGSDVQSTKQEADRSSRRG